jgi:hypothetical protein
MSRVLLLDADKTHDVFDLIDIVDGVLRVRTAFLFEIGEELRVRVEQDGATSETTARVRAHTAGDGGRVTELELVTPP